MSSFSSFLIAVLVGCLGSLELTVNVFQAFPLGADEEDMVMDPFSFGFLLCSRFINEGGCFHCLTGMFLCALVAF